MPALVRFVELIFSIFCGTALATGLPFWRFPEYRRLALRSAHARLTGKPEVVPASANKKAYFGLDFGKCTEADLQRSYLELEKLVLRRYFHPALDLARLYYL